MYVLLGIGEEEVNDQCRISNNEASQQEEVHKTAKAKIIKIHIHGKGIKEKDCFQRMPDCLNGCHAQAVEKIHVTTLSISNKR
jgi:hypothetical protein